ncbi:MAG: (Fe-S)-binding protein [Stagnimonas sp.]|nr:(Fe-S)-binding protein [Stagnimonas sp.]
MDSRALLAAADLCVKCGLCLPHCPTYQLSRHEADGPRGRIALAQGLASGQLLAGARLQAHLDGCLSCRACEAVCPAKVPYGAIADAARARLVTPARSRRTRWLGALLDRPWARTLLRAGLWLLPAARSGGYASTSDLARLWAYRPRIDRLRAVPAPPQAEIALFTGCVGDVVERGVLRDAQRLFAAAGVAVAIPPDQGCCGALHQHCGLPEQADERAARNARAFAGCAQVLPLASGCGAALRDLGGAATDGSSPLAGRVRDLCTVLAQRLDARPPLLRPMPLRVAIHTACTQANVFGAKDAVRRLLARVPQIELVELAPESGCCGAAGLGFLTQPGQADRLREPKLDAAATSAPQVIVSANIGCAMHLAVGLHQRGLVAEVLHPVSLLARALA